MKGIWRVGLLLLLMFALAPFAAMLLTALKDNGEIATHPLLPGRWVWGNLIEVWHSALPVYFRNTLIIAACATVLNLSVALPAAYALARASATLAPRALTASTRPPAVTIVPPARP